MVTEARRLELPHVDQLVVLGRGMSEGGNAPGPLTEQRGIAAGVYARHFLPITVVYSGNASVMADDAAGERLTEARALQAVADVPATVHEKLEERSNSTLTNFVELMRGGYLDPNLLTGVLGHDAHMRRALWLGTRIMNPKRPLIGISAEALGAEPESSKQRATEVALLAKERYVLRGVKPGDYEEAARREATIWDPARSHLKGVARSLASYR